MCCRMRRVYSDHYERHKNVVRKSVKAVSDALINLVNDERLRIRKGVCLCSSCRMKLHRDPADLPIRQDVTNDQEHSSDKSSLTRPALSNSISTPSPVDADAFARHLASKDK